MCSLINHHLKESNDISMKILNQFLFVALLATTTPLMAASSIMANSVAPVQERQVGNFKGVAISGSMKAFIKIGQTEGVRLEGNQEAIADLITEVKSGILVIRPKTKWIDGNRKLEYSKITIYITAKNLTSLTMSGSGSVEVQDAASATEFAATLSGSGSMKLPANVKAFTAVISGSGNMDVSGKADDANIIVNGSGDFKGSSFTVAEASAKISGSGSVYITANKKINALTVGSGSVFYKGNPAIDKKSIGSGRVEKI
jgi:hypothetical protein